MLGRIKDDSTSHCAKRNVYIFVLPILALIIVILFGVATAKGRAIPWSGFRDERYEL